MAKKKGVRPQKPKKKGATPMDKGKILDGLKAELKGAMQKASDEKYGTLLKAASDSVKAALPDVTAAELTEIVEGLIGECFRETIRKSFGA